MTSPLDCTQIGKAERYVQETIDEAGPELGVSNLAWAATFMNTALNLMLAHGYTPEQTQRIVTRAIALKVAPTIAPLFDSEA